MKLFRSTAKFMVAFIAATLIFSLAGTGNEGDERNGGDGAGLADKVPGTLVPGTGDAGDEEGLAGEVPGTLVPGTGKSGTVFVDKDETVYASLDGGGGVKSLTVVNLMRSTQAGGMSEFVDYAVYSKIVPLSENIVPSVYADKVVFTLPDAAETFYYRGDPANTEIPFAFAISYTLDGKKTDPLSIAGKSGKAGITLTVSPNPDSESYFLDNYMCQIQVPLSLNIFSNITSTGGQAVIAGSTVTYSFTVLPGQTGTYQITAEASLFETASASIVCIPFSLKNLAGPGFDIKAEDLDALLGGADSLADGAKELSKGIGRLYETLDQLAGSADELAAGQDKLSAGFSQFVGGIETLSAGISQFSQGLSSAAAGGLALDEGFTTLHNNLSLFLSQLTPLTATLPADQQAAFQYQVAAIEGGLDSFSDSLTQYVQAVQAMAQASGDISTGAASAAAGGQALRPGFDALTDGTKAFAAGINKLSDGTSALYKGAKKAADGQSEMAAGLRRSLGLFEALIVPSGSSQPASFANPEVAVRSVQFVINTPEIRMASSEPAPEEPVPEKNIWQKFLDLFSGIFR